MNKTSLNYDSKRAYQTLGEVTATVLREIRTLKASIRKEQKVSNQKSNFTTYEIRKAN